MKTIHCSVFLSMIFLFALGGGSRANVWIDEDFDDSMAFDAGAIDTYDSSPPPSPGLTFAAREGILSTARALNGSYSYLLEAGQSLAVDATAYENPTNGAFQYLQFGVSPGAIPAPGTMAELRWNWRIASIDYSFFVQFQSTGSDILLIAGEDLAGSSSETIATFSDTASWKYLTLQFQKNAAPATDSRTGQTVSQGMRFYINDSTPKLELPLPGNGAQGDTGLNWSIRVDSGSLYMDDFYWEGGMTNGGEANGNLRPFEGPGAPSGCGVLPDDYPVQLLDAQVDPVYKEMLRPRLSGWLGSDVAHSIPLSATQTLWLFGDTFIGTVTNGKRDGGAAFINNSIGIQDRTASPPDNMEFYWGPGNTSFFPHQAGTQGNFYWPTMGVLLNDELFIYCYNVSGDFSLPGATLIRIPNPHDPPDEWIQNAYDLGLGDNHRNFHTAVFLEEPYLYFLGFDDPGDNALNRRSVLARARTEDLKAGGLSEVYEFWVEGDNGPEWGSSPEGLITLFEPGNTETGIQYDSDLGLYYCFAYRAFAPSIYLTTAPRLTGPWSEPVCVYEIPEYESVSFDIISYAVRPHPELSRQAGEIVLTYATNAFGSIAPLFTGEGLEIYFPRFVRLQLEDNASRVCGWRLY